MESRPPLRGSNVSLADRFLGNRAYRPMVLTIAGAMLVLFGSMYMGMRQLGGTSDTFLNAAYSWCFVLSLWIHNAVFAASQSHSEKHGT